MIEYLIADLDSPGHANALVTLLNHYAQHPMGGGEPLPEFTRANLASTLAKRNDCIVILAYDDDKPIGLCNCFECFSTFSCQPILNIHDVYVEDGYRGKGVAKAMMSKAESIARERGCCKVTLEVLSENEAAKTSYRASGYAPYQLDANFGQAEFWQKYISD